MKDVHFVFGENDIIVRDVLFMMQNLSPSAPVKVLSLPTLFELASFTSNIFEEDRILHAKISDPKSVTESSVYALKRSLPDNVHCLIQTTRVPDKAALGVIGTFGKVTQSKSISKKEIWDYLETMVLRNYLTMPEVAKKELLLRLNGDVSLISKELAKLEMGAQIPKNVTLADVYSLVPDFGEGRCFDIINMAVVGNFKECLRLFYAEKDIPGFEFKLVGALVKFWEQAYLLLSTRDQQLDVKILNITETVLDQKMTLLNNWKPKDARRQLALLFPIMSKIKNFETDALCLLEFYLLEIAHG